MSPPVDPFVENARRLVGEPTPATWLGLVVHVVREQECGEGVARMRLPAHFLGAAWAPFERGFSRWPECVVIGSPRAENAIAELLEQLPPDATLFLADLDALDGALAAEILLASDRNLEAYQREGLASFVAAERARTARIVHGRYTDRDAGFERFRAEILRHDAG
jgi:hypothetical protein